jgi:DNA-binding response OmpR family regulator
MSHAGGIVRLSTAGVFTASSRHCYSANACVTGPLMLNVSERSQTDLRPLYPQALMPGSETYPDRMRAPEKSLVAAPPGVRQRVQAILLIEDDPDIASVIKLHLEDAHYRVTVEHDGERGLQSALSQRFDLLILDLMLPGIDGLDICKRLARESRRPRMLILSARSTELDRVLGLELGADDYLTKPFSVVELVARVRAVARRPSLIDEPSLEETEHLVSVGSLVVDRWERSARLAGENIDLTTREFELLLWFARQPGRVFSRAELLDAVWGDGYDGFEHTVNSHLNRLRSKLEIDPSKPKVIVTVRGAGYKLVAPE